MSDMNKEIFFALKSIGVSEENATEVAEALSKRDKEFIESFMHDLDKESEKREKLAEKIVAINIKLAGIFALQAVIGAIFFAFARGFFEK